MCAGMGGDNDRKDFEAPAICPLRRARVPLTAARAQSEVSLTVTDQLIVFTCIGRLKDPFDRRVSGKVPLAQLLRRSVQ